jgi:DNA-binding MarR family transcriptional regulator
LEEKTLLESNFKLWSLIGRVSHSIVLARQKELNQYHIPVRQYQVLRTIQDLGPNATLSEVARVVEREDHVISKQAVSMEKDGLIRRVKNTPKKNLLKLELTEKGFDVIKIARQSKSMDTIFSFMSEADRRKMESMLNAILTNLKEFTE